MTTIELNEERFTINNVPVSFPMEVEALNHILKASCRKTTKKHGVIFTWDELGITGHSKIENSIDRLTIYLEKEDFDFSPKEVFKGQFKFKNEDIIQFYQNNADERVSLFSGDNTGALVTNNIQVWFDVDHDSIICMEIGLYLEESKPTIPKEKYVIQKLDEEGIVFTDFGFKLSVIQEFMYNQGLLQPKFDLFEFVDWYDKRDIDLEEEGYEPIPEVTQYFRDLPIPKRMAPNLTKIIQDGGNEIYLQLIRFAEGYEDYWDIKSVEDVKYFPNLTEATLCYAEDHVLDDLKEMGIDAKWL